MCCDAFDPVETNSVCVPIMSCNQLRLMLKLSLRFLFQLLLLLLPLPLPRPPLLLLLIIPWQGINCENDRPIYIQCTSIEWQRQQHQVLLLRLLSLSVPFTLPLQLRLVLVLVLGTFVASSVFPHVFCNFCFWFSFPSGLDAFLPGSSSVAAFWARQSSVLVVRLRPTGQQQTNNFSGHDTKIDSMSSLFGSLIDMSNQAAEMCPQNAASNDTDNETSEPNNDGCVAFRLPLWLTTQLATGNLQLATRHSISHCICNPASLPHGQAFAKGQFRWWNDRISKSPKMGDPLQNA